MNTEKITKWILFFLALAVGAIVLLYMPIVADFMSSEYKDFSFLKLPGLVILYISVVPFYMAIFEIWKLMDMVIADEVFTNKAVDSINKIRLCAFVIFILYAVCLLILILLRVPVSSAYLTIVILDLSALSFATILTVLKKVLIKTVEMKEENELTI